MTTANIISIICNIVSLTCLIFIIRNVWRMAKLKEQINQDVEHATEAYEKPG